MVIFHVAATTGLNARHPTLGAYTARLGGIGVAIFFVISGFLLYRPYALAHLSRLQIFFFLVRQAREVPAGEIQAELEIPGPTLSHHLDALRRAGLVQSRKEERFVYYAARPDTVSELVRLLTACC